MATVPQNRPRFSDPGLAAHDRLYRTLRQQILYGELPPGKALTVRGLASAFGVSMTPAREALRRLAAEGALSLSLSGRVTTPVLSQERIEELSSIRAMLEPELASRALPRVHMALIDRMQTLDLANQEAAARRDGVAYVRTNLEFHRALYLRAQAPAILALAETVWLQLGPTMANLYGRLNRRDPSQHHRLIIAALKAGDEPGLRLAVRTDVTQGLRHVMA